MLDDCTPDGIVDQLGPGARRWRCRYFGTTAFAPDHLKQWSARLRMPCLPFEFDAACGPFKAPYLAALVASSCSTSASGVPSEGGRINADAADNGREVGCEAISVRYLDSSSHLTAWAILAGLPKASPRPFLAASASVQDHSARSDATVGAGGRSIITTGAPASRPRSNSTYTGIHWKEALAGTGPAQ